MNPGELFIVKDNWDLDAMAIDDRRTVFSFPSQTPVIFLSQETASKSGWTTVRILTPKGILVTLQNDLTITCYRPQGRK
jgi:hypothetical protein